jgi:hypothetical protein
MMSKSLLKRAHRMLPRPDLKDEEQFCHFENEFFEFLEHNEHELALDKLENLGKLVLPRGGFWKTLIRAATNMDLIRKVPYYEEKYSEVLSRQSKI